MKLFSSFRFKLLFLLAVSLIVNLIITGGIIIGGRLAVIGRENIEMTRGNSQAFVMHTEELLDSVGKQVQLLAITGNEIENSRMASVMEKAISENPLVQTFFLLDSRGTVLHVVEADEFSMQWSGDLLGNDLSSLGLFRMALETKGVVWSDAYISPLVRRPVIGAACNIENRVVIAEVYLDRFIENLKRISMQFLTETWVFDRNGRLIVDTESNDSSAVADTSLVTLVDRYLDQPAEALDRYLKVGGKPFFIGGAQSEDLKWLFISRVDAGFANPSIKAVISDIFMITGMSLVIVMGLVLLLMRRLSGSVDILITRTRAVTGGRKDIDWSDVGVSEFDELNQAFRMMITAVEAREAELKTLNEGLEQRVAERTAELSGKNKELSDAIQELKRTQEELSRSENLASLGRMVAGIAHELNTPIGNGMMAVSSMADQQEVFERTVEGSLKKTELMNYLQNNKNGLSIARRNLEKAAELVTSFKQVANDQSSNQRRTFHLDQMMNDLLITLQPTLKRSPHHVETDFRGDIVMDSFPGVLGQIVTNIINNALLHAWYEGEEGTIMLRTRMHGDLVHLYISDNGHGIPKEYQSKIFDPFFTTKQGSGGTGLGLGIAMNGAENILGGSIFFTSSDEEGTSFLLEIPARAPELQAHPDQGAYMTDPRY